jgi:SHS family lactate transporter-like MFS transporter
MGAFAMQFAVQGAWGIVPVHLNELSPDPVRATLPGFTYQIGNLISSPAIWVLPYLAEHNDKQYGWTMAIFIGSVAVLLALVTMFGPEAKGRRFGASETLPGATPVGSL